MSKILATGDLHLTDIKPGRRVEQDFFAFQLALLDRITGIAVDQQVSVVVVPGDITHTRRVSNHVITGIADWLSDLRMRKIQVLATLGQHDVRGHAINRYSEDSDTAILAHLCPNFTILTSGNTYTHEDVCFHGFGFAQKETIEMLEGLKVSSGSPVNLGIIHATVGVDGMNVRHIHDTHIKGLDYAVFGDVHQGFPPCQLKNKEKTWAFGCGVLTPLTIAEKGIPSQIAIIDTHLNSVSIMPLLEGSDPLSYFDESSDDTFQMDTTEYRDILTQARNQHFENDLDLVRRIGNTLKFSKDAIDLLVSHVQEHTE